MELLFKALIGYSYLELTAAHTSAARATELSWYAGISAPFTALFFLGLAHSLAPIWRWHRAERTGAATDAHLERAGEALYRLPRRAAWLWTFEWGATFAVLLSLRAVTCTEAGVLFFITMVTGPQPVASTIAFWLAAPTVRRVSLLARERALTLRTPSLPLRRRLATFGMLVAIAPTTYVASFAFSAQVSRISVDDMVGPILICCAAIAAFAVISASLMAASITGAVASMAEVIRAIAHQGDVTRVARIPPQLRDEIGTLAASTNEMIDRLERTAEERAAMSESLEALNHALEQRVEERTTSLVEANVVLEKEIAARAQVEIELRHAQKLEAVGRLAAGIAHEINTPVQFVSDSVQFVSQATEDIIALIGKYQVAVRTVVGGAPSLPAAEDAVSAEQTADLEYVVGEIPTALKRALEGLDRVSAIVRSMKSFARQDQDMRDVDLNEAIRNTLTIAHHEYKYVADVDIDFGDLPLVRCHAGEINQVVLNLLVNAAHAIADVHPDGATKGRIGVKTFTDGLEAVIDISDTGSGIPEHIRDRIFDPFFTTKDVNRGTGQGLAIARAVVTDKHGGSLRFTTELGKGSTFTIRLPISGARADLAA
ncbi:MAG TPA: ATP-binding protein [Kofleriaceae bacterium]|nr:ATP-binding protein [Kofleriaceae bacterium]